MSTPVPTIGRAGVDQGLESLVTSVRTQAAAEADARNAGNPTKWMRPPLQGWSGDLFDYAGIAKAFDSETVSGYATDAVADSAAPGTSGDLTLATLQLDVLGAMERSWRERNMGRARAIAHMSGRKYGHGHERGTLVNVIEYLRDLAAKNKTRS